jgi:nitrogen regulatory protein PII
MILAVIQPLKLTAVREALERIGVERMTVLDAQGYARQRGRLPTYRGHEYKTNLLRKVTLEIIVNDDFVQRTVDTIAEIARTGSQGTIGDGKIFMLPVDETIRIGKTLRGPEAV